MGVESADAESLGGLPGAAAISAHHRDDQEEPDVEVLHAGRVERVDQRLAARRKRQTFDDVRPAQSVQQEEDDDQDHNVREEPLDEVRQENGNLAAQKGEKQAESQQERHDQREDNGGIGQAAVMNQEPGADGGKHSKVNDPAEPGDHACKDSQLPAVANLQELRQRHGPRLAEPVGHPTGNSYAGGVNAHEELPPRRRESRLVINLKESDESERRQGQGAAGNRDRSEEHTSE